MIKYVFLFLLAVLFYGYAGAQQPAVTYPRITGYVGILHPLVTFNKDTTINNFNRHYTGGLPVGINIWKSAHIGFSLELVPLIRAANASSKVNNLLFHPGVLISLGHGFTLAGRAAFETGGRYGFTPVLNKIVKRNKTTNYFVAVPLPVRFGNDQPSSFAIGFQFGIAF
jgi:hypothetical protein